MMLKTPIVAMFLQQLGLLTFLYNKDSSCIHKYHSRYYESLSINQNHAKHQDSPPTTYDSMSGMGEDWMVSDFTISE